MDTAHQSMYASTELMSPDLNKGEVPSFLDDATTIFLTLSVIEASSSFLD